MDSAPEHPTDSVTLVITAPAPIARADTADQKQTLLDALRLDGGWVNLISGYNVAGRDKRTQTAFEADLVTVEDALNLWRGDDIAARIIEEPINDALREGFCLHVAEDSTQDGGQVEERYATDLISRMTAVWDELGLATAIATALKYERAYGGAAILLGVNDGAASQMEPLNLEARNLTLEWITELEPREIAPYSWYTNPAQRKFGKPEIYQISPQNVGPSLVKGAPQASTTYLVHESRLAIFPGIVVSRRPVARSLSGWGDNVLSRVIRVLRDFNSSYDSAGILLQDFSQAVFKMKGLSEILSADNAGAFKTRMEMANYSRSVLRAILIDSEGEDFERKSTSVTGLPELLDRFERRLAAATGIPLTRLMGMSPGGLNATGESDIRFYYDGIKSIQTEKAVPAIRYITKILFRTMGGEPADWSIKFPPLWQPTAKEKAETRFVVAQTDAIYLDRGVVSPDEVAKSRWGGDEYSMETEVEDRDRVDPIESNTPDEQAMAELEAAEPDLAQIRAVP